MGRRGASYGWATSCERPAEFYRRTLTGRTIMPEDQAEAIFLLLSERRFGRTTGQIISVDGGLTKAFLR